MGKYDLSWKEKNQKDSGMKPGDIMEMFVIVFIFYVLMSIWSLSLIATGENIPYMPFWHAPWEWLAKFLDFIF